MKKITVFFLGVMFAVVSYAQSNNSQSREVYAFVMVVETSTKTWAKIDFGDGSPRMAFADEKGKIRKFETIFEPINLLIKNGWEIEKFSSMFSSINIITHWIMKKKVNEESEVKEGMKLIED